MNKLELNKLFNELGYLEKEISGKYVNNNGDEFDYVLEGGGDYYHYLHIYNKKIDRIIENKIEDEIWGKDEYYNYIVINKSDNSIVISIANLRKEIEEYDDITDFIIYTIDDCIYLKTEETEEDEKIQKIKEFIENDTIDYNRALVINENNEYEERYDFNKVKNCFKCTDKDVIAVSEKNWEYMRDICDNCLNDKSNKETDESCNLNKIECAIDDIIASNDYFKEYLEDYKRQQELKKYRSDKND